MSESESDLENLFNAARQLKDPQQRLAFLAAACADQPTLRRRLERLLDMRPAADAFFNQPINEDTLPAGDRAATMPGPSATTPVPPVSRGPNQPDESLGTLVGRYKLLQKIGEGGCGVVYMAEQVDPVVRRVALKVIKLGMDTRSVIARFEAEQQALALMDHPNIARVLDAGATNAGRPFFVMELVRGVPITQYCDENTLSPAERLQLFMQVCRAIQHAHQKGVIHRDIKPSNILVALHDGVPVPKVIDFGIAKATQTELTENAFFTQFQQFVGTPAYMSPEQAERSGVDIDTRSDIYSLGVLLYELLTGKTPFDAKELLAAGLDEMRRTIREKEPVRPSTRLSTMADSERTTVAKDRKSELPRLMHLLSGDLDLIVMKTLEKDRTRRYATANGLAADIQRHLGNEPVEARPPSNLYRFQKLVRRNKLTFSAAGAVAAVLLLGIIASTSLAVRATHAKREAWSARQQAEASEKKAIAAQAEETKLREEAQAQALAARQGAYVADMNVAKQALDNGTLGRALSLLDQQRPKPGQKDMRGWEWRYLWQQCQSDALYVLCQKTMDISSLAVSQDGQRIAIGERGKSFLLVMDLKSQKEIARVTDSSEFDVHSAQMQPSVTVRTLPGGRIQVSDRATGVERWTAKGTGESLWTTTAFSPDERILATAAGYTNTPIRLWDVTSGKEIGRLEGHRSSVSVLVFWPDGKTLASASADQTIRLWDVNSLRPLGVLRGHKMGVGCLVLLPDKTTLVSGCEDGSVYVWDTTKPQRERNAFILPGTFDDWVFSPDNKSIVTMEGVNRISRWTGTDFQERELMLDLSTNLIRSFPELSPDGRTLGVNLPGDIVQVWDVFQHVLLRQFAEPAFAVGFSEGGRKLIIKNVTDKSFHEWDLTTWQETRSWRDVPNWSKTSFTGPANRWGAFSMDGRWCLTVGYGGAATGLTELASGREINSTLEIPGVMDVALSPDGKYFAVASFHGFAGLWETATMREVAMMRGFMLSVDSVAFSPDGTRLATGSAAKEAVKLWDVSNHQELIALEGQGAEFNRTSFSPDGNILGSLNSRGQLHLWRAPAWAEIAAAETRR